MKTKTRIKSFFRHNKKCYGMWLFFYQLIITLLPPYPLDTTLILAAVCMLYLALWKQERRTDFYRRSLIIQITKRCESIHEATELRKKYYATQSAAVDVFSSFTMYLQNNPHPSVTDMEMDRWERTFQEKMFVRIKDITNNTNNK